MFESTNKIQGSMTVLERIEKSWSVLRSIYTDELEKPFPFEGKREMVSQLVALLNNIRFISTHSQTTRNPASCTTLLVEFFLVYLQDGNPIQMSKSKCIEVNEIHPVVKHTRVVLREALVKRFYNRYAETKSRRGAGKPSQFLLMETATVMHPLYKTWVF